MAANEVETKVLVAPAAVGSLPPVNRQNRSLTIREILSNRPSLWKRQDKPTPAIFSRQTSLSIYVPEEIAQIVRKRAKRTRGRSFATIKPASRLRRCSPLAGSRDQR